MWNPLLRLLLFSVVVVASLGPGTPVPAQERSCLEFDSQIWAQQVLDDEPLDAAGLDPDGNGIACEELPPGFAPASWVDAIPSTALPAEFRSVVDGDTIEVAFAGNAETVRLLLVDAPEPGDPSQPNPCFADEAARFVAELFSYGPAVLLQGDITQRDKEKRLLRYVWLDFGDGHPYLLNEILVRNGYGVRSVYPPNDRYVDQIGDAQASANAFQRGIWSQCDDPRLTQAAASVDRGTALGLRVVGNTIEGAESGASGAVRRADGPADLWPDAPPDRLIGQAGQAAASGQSGSVIMAAPAAVRPADPVAVVRSDPVLVAPSGPAYVPPPEPAYVAPEPVYVAPEPVAPEPPAGGPCDPSYPTLCIPPGAPDMDCPEVGVTNFPVLPPDPMNFDREPDGIGCESQ